MITIPPFSIYAAGFPGATDWITVPTIRPDNGDVAHHPFDGEIGHFVDCILNDTESHVNLADAAKTHADCCALDRSVAEGRPVRIELRCSARGAIIPTISGMSPNTFAR
jgi:predicted dehydrogenase